MQKTKYYKNHQGLYFKLDDGIVSILRDNLYWDEWYSYKGCRRTEKYISKYNWKEITKSEVERILMLNELSK